MTHDHLSSGRTAAPQEATEGKASNLSAQQLADLEDEVAQAEYRKAYLRQLELRACPGCGDG
ncbi:MAG: hypothetical protein RJP95_01500 [Pirellulales bacterium]